MKAASFKSVLLVVVAVSVVSVVSCLKPEDLPKAKSPSELENHYCNDPRAENYNRGFPGIPDSSVCVYPVDAFSGQWTLTDSVFKPDSTFDAVSVQTISFAATEDTLLSHLKITGLCSNGAALYATADKYGQATLDSMDSHNAGQFLCSAADTATGKFYFSFSGRGTMLLQLQVIGTQAGFHKGTATKL